MSSQLSALRLRRALLPRRPLPFLRRSAGKSVRRLSSRPDSAPIVKPVDGNEAAAYAAYAMSDNAFIYPISPATPMGENVDRWQAEGKPNLFGRVPDVWQMQSEAGAAGALHGTISAGAMSSTFTASQGLLLMIPNMYLLAGELQPAVIHVAARALARQALSIFNDHSDVMAVRQTGWALLNSHNVQEAADMAFASHIATLRARVPFVHFFDGLRTSHEIQKIKLLGYDAMKPLVPHDAIAEHRRLALNPVQPSTRGTGMRPDTYMQASLAANSHFERAPGIVQETFDALANVTGRQYHLFDYYGAEDADRVIVIMGSASGVCQEIIDYLAERGERVGVVKPRLYRPWSAADFLNCLPDTARAIAVLDRTKEDGSMGLPLYLDVLATLFEAGDTQRKVVNGCFGLASKEFTPAMALTVYDELKKSQPRNHFVVGVDDDVSNSSLGLPKAAVDTTPTGTRQAMFWGTGGDGTVGANKQAIKIISDNTDMFAQGYFAYDSKKQGGVTMSHLRFGPEPLLTSTYQITHAHYVAVHTPSYAFKFDVTDNCVEGGTLVLNTAMDFDDMEKQFPSALKRSIAEKNLEFYAIDALDIAHEVGLGKRVNMIMQAVYFKLSSVLPLKQSLHLLDQAIDKLYGAKGSSVVSRNKLAVSRSLDALRRIEYPLNWGHDTITQRHAPNDASIDPRTNLQTADEVTRKFVFDVMDPMLSLRGDNLPVSAFEPGNRTGVGTTQFERRVIAKEVPVWIEGNCTQCNYCAIACPHAAIRPFLFDKAEKRDAPDTMTTIKSKGSPELAGLNYSIQVAPFGCTGCAVCVSACPDDALVMKPLEPIKDEMDKNWTFSESIPTKSDRLDKFSVKGSQFQEPLLEFSSACSGCGETPYVKLATQLFGDRMVIANSSGCSSVWGGTFGEIPYKSNQDGRGPAWGRSLFEDTAEYGVGMYLASQRLRNDLKRAIQAVLDEKSILTQQHHVVGGDGPAEANDEDAAFSKATVGSLEQLLKHWDNHVECTRTYDALKPLLSAFEASENENLQTIARLSNYITAPSHWIIGGDGWAYDIGYGGLDHVLASGSNVNILILDTEMYSNTGGQVSKATPKGSYAKYAMKGKQQNKKDIGQIAMTYGHVYVASCSLAADYAQCVAAMREAEAYDGPSLIITYATCVDWGHSDGADAMIRQQKEAVDSGYWPLYRFDPRKKLADPDASCLTVDSPRSRLAFADFIGTENRFTLLTRKDQETKERATKQQHELSDFTENRLATLRQMAMDREELLDKLKASLGEQVGEKVLVAYASETGNAASVARSLAFELKSRSVRAACKPLNDVDVEDLATESTVLFVAATCGQGEWPANARAFWADLEEKGLPDDLMKNVKYGVFGLGDSGYVFFNTVASQLDQRMSELGATRALDPGLADDQADGGVEATWEEWKPGVYSIVDASDPPKDLPMDSYLVNVVTCYEAETQGFQVEMDYVPPGAARVPMTRSRLMTPVNYDRDIRHFEFDLKGLGMGYELGDSLGIWPRNAPRDVERALHYFGIRADDVLQLEDVTGAAREEPLPKNIQASIFFERVIDLFGKPRRRFYEMMGTLATDPGEKAEILRLLSPEGRDDLDKITHQDTVSHFDVMEMFPKTKPTIAQLLDYVPDVRPRLYSIASAARLHGDDALHLLVVADEWTTPAGAHKHGTATRYLRSVDPSAGDITVAARVNPAAVAYPEDVSRPLILSGLGTGLAPLRAAIEDRAAARRDGDETGKVALFFGSRHRKQEFPYSDEFEEHLRTGALTEFHGAFSRDQEEKVYVQDRIREQSKLVYQYLVEEGGAFYYCGTGGSAVGEIQKEVEMAFAREGGMSEAEAHEMVTDMRIKGQYNVESW